MLGSMVPIRRRFPGTFSRLENEMERFWDPVDRLFKPEEWEFFNQQAFPWVNIAESDDVFEVTAELPGVNPKDVKVEFQNGVLWISGEKKEEKEKKGRAFHKMERYYGTFNRRIDLRGLIKEPDIAAEFENGILKVVVPKSEELKPKQIKVKVH